MAANYLINPQQISQIAVKDANRLVGVVDIIPAFATKFTGGTYEHN